MGQHCAEGRGKLVVPKQLWGGRGEEGQGEESYGGGGKGEEGQVGGITLITQTDMMRGQSNSGGTDPIGTPIFRVKASPDNSISASQLPKSRDRCH